MKQKNTNKFNILDDLTIRNAKSNAKPIVLRDGNGLFLLVHPNGSKYFQVRYSFYGKARKIQLGVYPSYSLKEARQEADKIKELLKQDKDPSVEKKKTKLSGKLNSESTFKTIAEEWLHLKSLNIADATYKKISGMIRANTYDRLGRIPIAEIDTLMILETLKSIEARGALSLMHRVRALIAEIFKYAITYNLYKGSNPADALQRSIALKKHISKSYETLKTPNDIGIFLRRLNDYQGTIQTQLLVKLQMLVATRPSEMRTATWDEFDLINNVWTIKPERMKKGLEHIIPLPKQAISTLYELKKLTGYSTYLFPSHTTKSCLSEATANKALDRLWPEYKIHPHGFRHLFSTHANEHDYRWGDIIEAALAHKITNRIRGIYNKATYIKERRKLAQWYADYLDDLRAKAK